MTVKSTTVEERSTTRDRAVRRVLFGVLAANLVVATAKLVVGLATQSLTLLADAVHSYLDSSANVVGLIGMSLASRPPDRGHPYGHRRFETVAALVIGLLIAGGLFEIVRRVIDGLRGAEATPEVTWTAALVVLITIVVNGFISHLERKQGEKWKSSILTADAGHTRSDSLAATAVLISFGAVALGYPFADYLGAIAVCGFIAFTALRILRENLGVLVEGAQLDAQDVHRIVCGVEGVYGAHQIRSRGSADHIQMDLHIQVDPGLSVVAAHALTHKVIDSLRKARPEIKDVVIHTEPADGRELGSNIAPGTRRPP